MRFQSQAAALGHRHSKVNRAPRHLRQEARRGLELHGKWQDYEAFLKEGSDAGPVQLPADEWDAISLCYTSGTTGKPKGVVYHHRGAYLNALGCALAIGLNPASVYLWTLPMFHCNGWCFPWGVTAMGGTHLCMPAILATAAGPATAVEVKIAKFAYDAKEITVAPGTRVVWTNRDETPHTVTSDDKSFASKGLDTDDKFEHVS